MALTPEQLARYQSLFMDYNWRNQQKAQGNGGLEYLDPTTGQYVIPQFSYSGGDDTGQGVDQLSGFSTYDSNDPLVKAARESNDNFDMMGAQMGNYDAQGNPLGNTTFASAHKNGPMDYLLPALMMAAPFALTAAGVAGAGAAGAGSAGGLGTSIEALQAAEAAAGAGGGAGGGLLSGSGAMGAGGAGGTFGAVDMTTAGLGSVPQMGAAESLAAAQGYLPSVYADAAANAALRAIPPGSPGSAPPAAPPGSSPGAPTDGVMPPNPYATPGGAASLIPGVSNSMLGAAATGLGGLLGSQGEKESQTSTNALDPRMDAAVYGGLLPAAQSLLQSQLPQGQAIGGQMTAAGSNLLSRPVSGNGVGQITLNTPTTGQNPYLSQLADDIQKRTSELLGQNNLAIQGNSIASGGMGGSRMGVAQGTAAGKAADYLQGNLANLYGSAWNNDANRSMQQYGLDLGFFGNQRAQDLQQQTLGAGLLAQGQQAPWNPLNNTASLLANFKTGSTTNASQQGGGWAGGLGGLLGGAQFANSMGFWK